VPHDDPTAKAVTIQMTIKIAGSRNGTIISAVVRIRKFAVPRELET